MPARSATRTTVIPEWTVADRIRKARRTAGLSQQELADALDVQVGRLSNWEAGHNRPRHLEQVARGVAAATGVPAMWILGFEPEPGIQNWKEIEGEDAATVLELPRVAVDEDDVDEDRAA